ncbi:MAG: 50S ribosome-binding GTPase, partial [Clostridia bacterium]|nr:50S ribosome-binding GTPase [Clostridia bacterium]
GKSSFINRLAKGGKAKVEDRPGVTRDNRWFTVEAGALLLDTPGVLWPKFEDQEVARRLAYTGAIRDEILDCEELACGLLQLLNEEYRPLLCARYRLAEEDFETCQDSWDLLCLVGKKRGMLVSGGEVNTERAAIMLLDEFRSAKIGRITLELPEKKED